MKINTDEASKGKPGESPEATRAGWICRDLMGTVIMAMAAPIGQTTALVAETWALLLATRMALTRQWSRLQFELDSTTLLTLLKKNSLEEPCIIQNMIREIQSHLQQLGEFTISHIYREANQATDGLANRATQLQTQLQTETLVFGTTHVLIS